MNDTHLPDPATLAAYSDARLAMMPKDERDELARRLASAGRRDEAQRVKLAPFRASRAVDWRETVRMPDGGERAGDPSAWPETVRMPDGGERAGNPATWPETIDLPEDSQ